MKKANKTHTGRGRDLVIVELVLRIARMLEIVDPEFATLDPPKRPDRRRDWLRDVTVAPKTTKLGARGYPALIVKVRRPSLCLFG